MTGRTNLWMPAALLLGLTACATPSPPVTYYSLTPAPAAAPAPGKLAGKTIGVGPITVPDVPQLSRPAAQGRQVDEFHRWSGSLERELGRALVLQLSQRLGTEQVVPYPWSVPLRPDYQVVVDVLVFAVDDQEQAMLEARWSVLAGQDDEAPRIRAATIRRPVADATPAGRAAALRQAVAALGEEIAAQLLR